jgi:hypothetical protein
MNLRTERKDMSEQSAKAKVPILKLDAGISLTTDQSLWRSL